MYIQIFLTDAVFRAVLRKRALTDSVADDTVFMVVPFSQKPHEFVKAVSEYGTFRSCVFFVSGPFMYMTNGPALKIEHGGEHFLNLGEFVHPEAKPKQFGNHVPGHEELLKEFLRKQEKTIQTIEARRILYEEFEARQKAFIDLISPESLGLTDDAYIILPVQDWQAVPAE